MFVSLNYETDLSLRHACIRHCRLLLGIHAYLWPSRHTIYIGGGI